MHIFDFEQRMMIYILREKTTNSYATEDFKPCADAKEAQNGIHTLNSSM